jgi:hypothetical protein
MEMSMNTLSISSVAPVGQVWRADIRARQAAQKAVKRFHVVQNATKRERALVTRLKRELGLAKRCFDGALLALASAAQDVIRTHEAADAAALP